MSHESDAQKPAPGWERFLNVFGRGTPIQSTTPGSSQRPPDEKVDSYRLHSMPEQTPKRRRMDPKYNLQPSNWNSPAVNQRILQSKQSESGTPKAPISTIIPHPQTPAVGLVSKPPAATTGRRIVRTRRPSPSVFLSPPIKMNSVSNEEKRTLWNDLSKKTSFAKPRPEEEKYVGFRNGETMPAVNRLYNKRVVTKRSLLLEGPDENKDKSESAAPKAKRTRVSFEDATAADDASRNNVERNRPSFVEEGKPLPFRSMFTEPIVLHDYKGYRDPDIALYGDPLDDYKGIKKAAPPPVVVVPQEESPPWECKNCKTTNPNDESLCTKCKKSRSSKEEVTGWGDTFSKQKESWKCPDCYVPNDIESDHCVACDTARPVGSSDVSSNGAIPSLKKVISASKPVTFGSEGGKGAETKNEPPKFTFGAPITASIPTSSAPQSFSFGNASSEVSTTAPSFSFGSAPASSDATPKPQSFSFGNAPAPSHPSSKPPSFSFGKSTAPTDLPSKPQDPEVSPKHSAVSATADTSAKPFSFGGTSATSDTSAKPFSFGGTPATLDNPTKPFSFGGTPAPSETSAKPFSFGGTDTSSASATTPQSISFGSASATPGSSLNEQPAVSSALSDGKEEKPSAAASPAAPFAFGSSLSSNGQPGDAVQLGANSTSIAATSFAQSETSQSFQFGASSTTETPEDSDAKRKRSKPSFGFGGGEQLPSISENPSSIDSARQPISDSTPFSAGNPFDQTAKGDNLPSSGFAFGSKPTTLQSNANESTSPSQQFGATSTFSGAFGSTSAQADTNTVANSSATTFSSGLSTTNGFGSSSSLPPFGNAAQAPATFGAPAPPAFGTSVPSFGAPTLSAGFGAAPVPPFGGQPAPSSTAPMFGAAPIQLSSAAPAFGTPTFGAPNPFGSNAAAPAGFGMSAAPIASAPTFGGFNSAPGPSFGQTGQAPSFGAPATSQSFGQPSQQPPSFGVPQGFGGQAPSFGAGAADFGGQAPSFGTGAADFGGQAPSFGAGAGDGGFNLGSGGASAKRRFVRVRRNK